MSLVAIVALAGLAGWANIARRPPPLDEAEARARFEDFPHQPVDEVWVAADGSAALGHAGPKALLVWRWSDDYLLISLPLALVHCRSRGEGRRPRDAGDGRFQPPLVETVRRRRRLAARAVERVRVKLDPVTLATPFFILAIVLEIGLARLGKAEARYERRDTLTSLAMGLGSTVAGLLSGGIVVAATLWVYRFHLFEISMKAWWAWVILFFAEDLCYYVFHRLSHERRVWWASHVNHHSSQHYNLSTALRQTWTGGFALTWIVWLPLALIGFPPAMIAIQKGISLVYQFWIHTEAIGRMPRWFEAVLNTPSHHRVHHARNPRYLDRNYAGVLIIWDRMFGTFEPERDDEKPRYGIVHNLGDFNLARAAFHEWHGIGRDLWRARSWRERAGYVFGPPGWSPDGSRETSAALKAAWRRRNKAGPATPAPPAG